MFGLEELQTGAGLLRRFEYAACLWRRYGLSETLSVFDV